MIISIFEDETFSDNQATTKCAKIISTYMCLVFHTIAQVVLTEQYNINSTIKPLS